MMMMSFVLIILLLTFDSVFSIRMSLRSVPKSSTTEAKLEALSALLRDTADVIEKREKRNWVDVIRISTQIREE